jgi:hypothetical protein
MVTKTRKTSSKSTRTKKKTTKISSKKEPTPAALLKKSCRSIRLYKNIIQRD